jgi:hypothetical protein
MLKLKNPIPRIQQDPQRVRKLFEKFGIVPYYGNSQRSSHNVLRLFFDLCKNSPSHRACIRDKCEYSFGAGVQFAQKSVPGLYVEEDLTPSEIQSTLDSFENYGVKLTSIIESSKAMLRSEYESGNVWLWVKLINVAGEWRIRWEVVDYLNSALLKTDYKEPRKVVITESWDEQWWAINPPDVVSVSTMEDVNWDQTEDGFETVFHLKNEGSIYYGRPIVESILEWLFVEFSYGGLTAKISSTEIVSKNVIAIENEPTSIGSNEDEDEKDGVAQLGSTLRKLTSAEGNYGDVHSLGVFSYPQGVNQPTVLKFDVNRDHEYQEKALNQASSIIHAVHGWDKVISGMEKASSGIGSEMIINAFLRVNIGTIQPIQSKYSSVWNTVLQSAYEVIEDDTEILGIGFASLADLMIEKMNNDEST